MLMHLSSKAYTINLTLHYDRLKDINQKLYKPFQLDAIQLPYSNFVGIVSNPDYFLSESRITRIIV